MQPTKKYRAIKSSSINGRIDEIMFNAAYECTTMWHNDELIGHLRMTTVEENITKPIEILFNDILSPRNIELHRNDTKNHNSCSHFFTPGETIYTCTQCTSTSHRDFIMCEECFSNSNHVSHLYIARVAGANAGHCDCGDEKTWKSSNTCTIHKPDTFKTALTTDSRQHARTALMSLLNYLMKVGSSPFVFPDSPFIQNTLDSEIDDHQVKYCVLLINEKSLNPHEVLKILKSSIGNFYDHVRYAQFLDKNGIACVFYSFDESECHKIKTKIDNYRSKVYSEAPIRSLVTTQEHFMHMCICDPLMLWIDNFVCKIAELCEILCGLIFTESQLMIHYAHQETFLWKAYRHKFIYSLLSCVVYNIQSLVHLTKSYLQYLPTWFGNYMSDNHQKHLFFINLTVQIITKPSLAAYLIEHEFLFRIIDTFATELERLGIKKGCSFSKLYEQNPKLLKMIMRVSYACNTISECYNNLVDHIMWSSKSKEGVLFGALRFVQLLEEFKEIEPIPKAMFEKGHEYGYKELANFVKYIHGLMMSMAKLVVMETENANTVIGELWTIFESDFAKNIDVKDKSYNEILEQLIKFMDDHNDVYILLNLPVRFFTIILMDLILTDRLHNKYRDKIFKSEFILLWIAQPVLSSISFHFYYTIHEWLLDTNSRNAQPIISKYQAYFFYLFLHDFHFFQILIASVNPETFLRLMLLKLHTSGRNETDTFSSLGTLTQSPDQLKADMYEQFVRLLLSALTERHFIGLYSNPQFEFVKNQVVSFLSLGQSERNSILQHLTSYREDISDKILNDVLKEVAITPLDFILPVKIYELKRHYLQQVHGYFYLYYHTQISKFSITISNKFKNSLSYRPPPLAELRFEMDGMNDFIISDAFSSFLWSILHDSCTNQDSPYKHTNILEMVLICLGVIASTLLNLNSGNEYAEKCKTFFGPQTALEGKTLSQFLVDFKGQSHEYTMLRIIEYLLEVLESTCDNNSSSITNFQDEDKKRKVTKIKLRRSFLKQFAESTKRFCETNPDFSICETFQKGTIHSETRSIDTIPIDDNIFCFICNDTSEHKTSPDVNILSFPTELIVCARLRLTLIKLHDDYDPSCCDDNKSSNSIPLKLSLEEVPSWGRNLPQLILSGCCHIVHTACAQKSSAFSNALQVSVNLPKSYLCNLCNMDNNIVLPYMTPVYYNCTCEVGIAEFAIWIKGRLDQALNMSSDGKEAYLSRKNEQLTSNVITVMEELSSVTQDASSKDLFGCYFKNFIKNESLAETFHSSAVIAATHNCLSNTIKSIEFTSRKKQDKFPLFHPSFTNWINFRATTHLARFCYHSSGQAISLSPDSDSSKILLNSIRFGYALSFEPITVLLEHIFLSPGDNPTRLDRYKNTDIFSLFVSTFMGLSCINRINALLGEEAFSSSIEVSCVRLFYAILTVSIFAFFTPYNYPYETGLNPLEDDVEQISALFNLLCGQVTQLPADSKTILYQQWLFTMLPFCRQAAILYYQIFNIRPSISLIDSAHLPPVQEVKELLTYLQLPLDISRILTRDDLSTLSYYCTNARRDISPPPYFIESSQDFYKHRSLIQLPNNYIELINEMESQLCNVCHSSCKSAFKCLICGELVIESYTSECEISNSIIGIKEKLKEHVLSCEGYGSRGVFFCINPPYLCYISDGKICKLVYYIYFTDRGEPFSSRVQASLFISDKDYSRFNSFYQQNQISSLPSTIF